MFSFKKAQTLVETIMAVGIITMALVAILSLGAKSIYSSTQDKEEIVASNLAREGMEIVRAVRDSNWLDPSKNAFDGLGNGDWIISYNDTGAITQADSADINTCNNCKLYFTNGLYQHTAGVATPYKRLVKISSLATGEKKVVSKVSWTIKGRARSFNLETYLTDWR